MFLIYFFIGKLEHRKNERSMDNIRFTGPARMTQILSFSVQLKVTEVSWFQQYMLEECSKT